MDTDDNENALEVSIKHCGVEHRSNPSDLRNAQRVLYQILVSIRKVLSEGDRPNQDIPRKYIQVVVP